MLAVIDSDADNGTKIGNAPPVDAVSLSTENVGDEPTNVGLAPE